MREKDETWIKLYRKSLRNVIISKDADHFAVWNYLLLIATHREREEYFGKEIVKLKPGQLITGRQSISEKFKISESKIQRILKLFESEHQIEQQTCSSGRLITICNWEQYQGREQQNEQQNEKVNNRLNNGFSKKNKNYKKSNIKMNNDTDRTNALNKAEKTDNRNWSEQQNEQRVNNERTTSEQQSERLQECIYKNDKNEKEINMPSADPYGWED